MSDSPERMPKTPAEFRAKYRMGKARYHGLVNEGVIRQTHTGPRSVLVLPEDEDRFVAICRKYSPCRGAA